MTNSPMDQSKKKAKAKKPCKCLITPHIFKDGGAFLSNSSLCPCYCHEPKAKKLNKKEKKIRDNFYAYHVPNPFDEQKMIYDKYGCLQCISMRQYLEEVKKKDNIFKPTKFESIIPGICMVLGFLLICFIIGTSKHSL